MTIFFKRFIRILTNKTIIKLWVIFALSVIILKGVLPGWNTTSGDFNNYYVSAVLVSKNLPIHQFYDNDWFHNKAKDLGIKEGAKFSPFPPITAYAFLPVTIFKPLTAKRIWLLFNSILIILLPFRVRKITSWSITNVLLFLSLFTIPIASCLSLGQLYLVIGFLLVELFGQLYFINKPNILGLTIGILASLKYVPILFLAYIFKHEKRYRILLFSCLGILILSLIVFITDHQAYDVFFNHFLSHLQGDLPGQGKYAIPFQSIDSLLNNLFVYDQLKNPNPIIHLSILKPIIKLILVCVIFGLLLTTLKKNKNQMNPTILSIGMIGVFVLIPASATYHFLLLLWPILCIVKWLLSLKSKKTLVIISILIFMTFTVRHDYIPTIDRLPSLNLLLHYPRFWGLLCVFLILNYNYSISLKKNYG